VVQSTRFRPVDSTEYSLRVGTRKPCPPADPRSVPWSGRPSFFLRKCATPPLITMSISRSTNRPFHMRVGYGFGPPLIRRQADAGSWMAARITPVTRGNRQLPLFLVPTGFLSLPGVVCVLDDQACPPETGLTEDGCRTVPPCRRLRLSSFGCYERLRDRSARILGCPRLFQWDQNSGCLGTCLPRLRLC